MDVGRGEQFTATCCDPAFARTGLALGAVPIAAAVVGDGGTMSAARALINVTAECGGATARDGQQDLEVGPAEPVTVARDEVCACAANLRTVKSWAWYSRMCRGPKRSGEQWKCWAKRSMKRM